MVSFDVPGERPKRAPISVMNIVLIAVVCAVLGLACFFVHIVAGAVIFGAIGLLMGSFCMGSVLKHAPEKKSLLWISVIVMLLSVIVFMVGFVGLADSL